MTSKISAPSTRGVKTESYPTWRWLLLGATLALLAAWILSRFFTGQSFASHVTITNDTDYGVGIEVAGSSHDNWLALGFAPHHQTTVIDQVIDQGQTWTFRLRAQGRDAGEFTVTRTDLVRSKWQISIPVGIGARMRSAGIPPDP